MDFYYGKGSVAFAALIALEEVGVNYQLHKVDMSQGEQTKPAYLAKNPKGRVPLLVTKEGPISETPAILEYVASLAPELNLMPQGAYAAAKERELLSYLASTFHINHAMKLRGYRWSDDETVINNLKLKVTENMSASAQFIEDHYLDGDYLLGAYSIADMHLFAISNWFEVDGVDITKFPKLAAWRARMEEREAVKRAFDK